MLTQCGIAAHEYADGLRQSGPYNLLLRRGWMLLVPRAREHYQGISINSLGYAGSLFVRDAVELRRVEETGPMRILVEVSLPR
jgi:ATP adenylyltransferase